MGGGFQSYDDFVSLSFCDIVYLFKVYLLI